MSVFELHRRVMEDYQRPTVGASLLALTLGHSRRRPLLALASPTSVMRATSRSCRTDQQRVQP
jgi:hypothetical protein